MKQERAKSQTERDGHVSATGLARRHQALRPPKRGDRRYPPLFRDDHIQNGT